VPCKSAVALFPGEFHRLGKLVVADDVIGIEIGDFFPVGVIGIPGKPGSIIGVITTIATTEPISGVVMPRRPPPRRASSRGASK